MTPSDAPVVSVVVATYQRVHLLPALLGALEAQDLDPGTFEVVVVDNGTNDGTAAWLEGAARRTALQLRVLRIDENHGPVPARNAGWRAARASVVAFTDDDCTPHPAWLRSGLALLDARPEVGIVQGATEPAIQDRPGWCLTREVSSLTLLFEGCNLFARRAALEASGGFDERFFFFGEDTSMGWAVLEAGWEAAFAADARVQHAVVHPPFRAHLRERWQEQNLVRVARLHPGFRHAACWRPWCYRPDELRFVVGLAGIAAAARHPVALAATLPWLWTRVPRERPSRAMAAHLVKRAACDATSVAAMVVGSIRERTFLL